MSKKWFEVCVVARKTVVVEVDESSERDLRELAMEYAEEEAFSSCTNIESSVSSELTSEDEIENAKRHADAVSTAF